MTVTAHGLFVGGREITPHDSTEFLSTNPANGEPVGSYRVASASDVDDAVQNAYAAYPAWRHTAARLRGRVLIELAAKLRENIEALALMETLDMGQTLRQSRVDVETAARYFEYYGGGVDKFHGETIPISDDYLSYTVNEPFGVVAFVLPWNAPITQAARGVAPALAVGNVAVVKPAQDTPGTALMLAQLAIEIGLPPGVLNIVTGYGETGSALVTHPLVRKIAFTGSVETGKSIMAAASDRLVPLTLELGGKSPNIVFDDADLDAVAASAWTAFTTKTGQVCSAGSRLLVQSSIHDDLVGRLVERAEAASVGPGISDLDLGSLANAAQFEKVCKYLEVGPDEGATVSAGGTSCADGDLASGYFVRPTIYTDVEADMRIAQEEIFGPVLSVIRFADEDAAVSIGNGTDYGLVAGIWTQDIGRAHRVAQALEAGQVFINQYFAGGVETPFGGFKFSGFGREKGFEAMRHYTQTKTVTTRL